MLYLVDCHPGPDADPVAFTAALPAEQAHLRQMRHQGSLQQAWAPLRAAGALLLIDVPDEEAAKTFAAALPLARAELIDVTLIPLRQLSLDD